MFDIIKNIVLSLLILFAPIQGALCVVIVLIVLDAITGVWASRKRGEKFCSSKLKNSLFKILIYEMLIVMGYSIELYFTGIIPWSQIVMMFIAVTEFTSLVENAGYIIGRDIIGYVKEQMIKYSKTKGKNDEETKT